MKNSLGKRLSEDKQNGEGSARSLKPFSAAAADALRPGSYLYRPIHTKYFTDMPSASNLASTQKWQMFPSTTVVSEMRTRIAGIMNSSLQSSTFPTIRLRLP